jgi:polyisoprenoid-binding protein YceI
MRYISLLGLILSFSLFAKREVKLFVSLTPAGSFEATSEKLKGNVIKKGNSISADKMWVSIESMKTGIDLRDEHFWKHLNSNKYPKAVLTQVKGENGKAQGVLEINGVKKPIAIAYTEKDGHVLAKFNVKASSFNLKKAEYLGVGVRDDVKVEATYPIVQK